MWIQDITQKAELIGMYSIMSLTKKKKVSGTTRRKRRKKINEKTCDKKQARRKI